MTTGCGYLEGALRGVLPGDVGEVGASGDRRLTAGHCGGRYGSFIAQPRDDLAEGARRPDVEAADQRCLGTVRYGDDDSPDAGLARGNQGRQHAADRSQPTVEAKLGDPRQPG